MEAFCLYVFHVHSDSNQMLGYGLHVLHVHNDSNQLLCYGNILHASISVSLQKQTNG